MKENIDKKSRFTIDIPTTQHKKLKIAAATHGLSMREIIMESIENQLQKLDITNTNQSTEDKD